MNPLLSVALLVGSGVIVYSLIRKSYKKTLTAEAAIPDSPAFLADEFAGAIGLTQDPFGNYWQLPDGTDSQKLLNIMRNRIVSQQHYRQTALAYLARYRRELDKDIRAEHDGWFDSNWLNEFYSLLQKKPFN
jgi:hypothetical protein